MPRDETPRKRASTSDAVGTFFNILFFLVLSLVISILVEWLGLIFHWWDYTSSHSLEMMRIELGYANPTLQDVVLNHNHSGFVGSVMHYYMSAMHTFFYWCSQIASYITADMDSVNIYMDSAYNICLIFGLRVFLIIYSMPLFIMVLIWGFVDGLTERDLRRFGAGRESSTMFEAMRRLAFPMVMMPFFIYLSFPTSINPMLLFAPSAIAQALIYRVLFSKYKKYL